MSQRVLEALLRGVERCGAAFGDAVVLPLLIFPVAAGAAWLILGLIVRRVRGLSRRWYPIVCNLCLGAAACLALAGGSREQLLPFGALLLAEKLACVCFAVCGWPVSERRAKPRKAARPEPPGSPRGRSAEPLACPEEPAVSPPMPAKICCFAEEPPLKVEKDVRLGHIFSVLERLKELPLGAGDRLEAQKTEELLTVYRTKGALSPKEAETLNDILAALLKMMAKYKV